MPKDHEAPICRRCDLPVASPDYETFERMHYVCFHYEFKHGDVDVDRECTAGGCPSRPTANTQAADQYQPGQFAYLGVVFFDERDGRALIRLPNGSKTTVDFDALALDSGIVHFVRDPAGERAHCGECDWQATASSRVRAQEVYRQHHLQAHSQ